jgi:hypothetical protein
MIRALARFRCAGCAARASCTVGIRAHLITQTIMIIRCRSTLLAVLALLVLVCGAPAAAQPPAEAPPYPPLRGAEADAVLGVLRQYVDAVSRGDGEAAARLVTRGTRGYYARMRDMAVAAPEAEVRAAPLMDRLSILMMRHLIPPGDLRALTGDAVFAYTVAHGWLGEDAGRMPPGPLEVYGEAGRAIIRMEDGSATHFVREDGAWRWDMLPDIQAASTSLAPDPADGLTEDEFVILVLEAGSGREVSPTIWQPLP